MSLHKFATHKTRTQDRSDIQKRRALLQHFFDVTKPRHQRVSVNTVMDDNYAQRRPSAGVFVSRDHSCLHFENIAIIALAYALVCRINGRLSINLAFTD